MVKIDYVISAMQQGILPNHRLETLEHQEEISTLLQKISTITCNKAYQCVNYEPLLSLLFNAYTEVGSLPIFKKFNNLDLDSVYADSGGLQIVTAGREVTDEIKQEIYKQQTYADYAMCFDCIPLRSIQQVHHVTGKKIKSRNERSNVGNKTFYASEHKEAGIATGKNIKEQIEAFKQLEAKTKVIIIVQGNNKEDMKLYFNEIEKQLEDEDYAYIGGLAIADTCIGNGELESIEMLRAARDISINCHANISSHLHVLGVGSIKRLRPIIYLKQSGYLDKFDHISYDSSSHTSCFTYGLLKLNGTCVPLGTNRTEHGEKHFKNVYNFFESTLSEYVNEERFLDIVYGDGSPGQWSYSNIKRRARESEDKTYYIIAHIAKSCYTYFMIHNFIHNVDKMFLHQDHNHISPLLTMKEDRDIIKWINHQNHTNKKQSRLIKREENTSLEEFFN